MGFIQPFQQYIRGSSIARKTTYSTWGLRGFGAAAPGKALPCATFSHVDGQGHAPFRADRHDAARGSLGTHCGSHELPTQMEVARGTGHQCAGILADTREWSSTAELECRAVSSLSLCLCDGCGCKKDLWETRPDLAQNRGACSILRIFAPFLLSLQPVSLSKKKTVFFGQWWPLSLCHGKS